MPSDARRLLKRKRLVPSAAKYNTKDDTNGRALVTPRSFSTSPTSTALSVVNLALSLGESVAEAVPIAGLPVKAAIGAILKNYSMYVAYSSVSHSHLQGRCQGKREK